MEILGQFGQAVVAAAIFFAIVVFLLLCAQLAKLGLIAARQRRKRGPYNEIASQMRRQGFGKKEIQDAVKDLRQHEV